jgi:hypothetical protein
MRKRVSVCLLFVLVIVMVACQPFEKSARDSIAGAKGFIEQAQANHGTECRANPNTSLCGAINQAVAAQNAAIDALDLYCAGSAWQSGGACQPNKEAEPRVRAAIANLDRIIRDAKGAVGK